MKTKDISLSPRESINGRFHALGFTKSYEIRKTGREIHVFTRGDEQYKFGDSGSSIEKLLELEAK